MDSPKGAVSKDSAAKSDEVIPAPPSNFIRDIIQEDLKSGKHGGRVVTRFPPEPNGYLHIGHAKSICINFGLARDFQGTCHLRMDDTNPAKEDEEYVNAIIENVRWLGFDWKDKLFFASDYYEQLCGFAVELINKGKAYVCDLNADQIREFRGTLTKPGKDSPGRERPIDENLALFEKMKKGDFPDGAYVLRAKIDMASPNINMRDPVLYRILRAIHHRTGDKWCIYPMYDFAHPLSDAIEGITHSICTLEFEDHRPLYDWFINNVSVAAKPQQIEFARLNLTHTLMSKRKLLELVQKNVVSGWNDPRMPTLSGLRRRGFTPESIRDFCDRIGVAKANSTVDYALLEHCLREDLNKRSLRVMAVVKPLKLIIDNYPEQQTEDLDAVNNPEDLSMGTRKIPFSKVLFIEQEDFREVPPKGYYRLFPGQEVRLKFAYYVKCVQVVKDEKTGEVIEVHCTYDPATKGGRSEDGRKIKGTLHWVSAAHALQAEVRQYENLFQKPDPEDLEEGESYLKNMNPNSLAVFKDCQVEPGLKDANIGSHFQFERTGYFCVDTDFQPEHPVFNRTVSLRDSWAKMEKAQK